MFSIPKTPFEILDTPEPAVIVGVGKVGSEILAELIERWEVHRAFQTPNVDAFERLVEYVDLFGLFEGDVAALSAVDARKWFLKDGILVEVAHRIKGAFHRVRFHSQQPLVSTIEPKLFIIGATWEPMGAALLWPLAELVRRVINESTTHYLIGVFVAANHNAGQDEQEDGDAHTFVTLKEGDATLFEEQVLPWQERIRQQFPKRTSDGRKHLYDHLFLLDGLKANNATVETRNDDWELRINVSALLEGLIYTSTYRLLDNALLDDYLPQEQQIYIGAGTSTLRVPLEEILQLVRDYAVGSVIEERLLPLPAAEKVERIRNQATVLAHGLIRELDADSNKRIERYFEEEGAKEIRVGDNDHFLNYKLMPSRNLKRHFPAIPSIEISGTNPFSGEHSLHVNVVLSRLRAEVVSRAIITRDVRDLLEARQNVIEELLRKTHEVTAELLRVGDQGLWQAEELLKTVAESIEAQAQNLQDKLERLEKDRRFAHLRDRVEGMGRWYYTRRLRPVVSAKPRLSALLLRSALLVVLLFQFYWSGVYRGILFWPLDVLNFQSFQELTGSGWDWVFFALLWIPALTLVLFLAGVPTYALWRALQSHRGDLAALLQLELSQTVLQSGADQLEQIAEQLQRRQVRLEAIQAELIESAKRFRSNSGEGLSSGTYLEYVAVTPQSIADFQQRQEITKLTLDQYEEKFIESWQQIRIVRDNVASASDIETVDVQDTNLSVAVTVQRIIEFLQHELQPAVHKMVIKSVEDYLNPDEHDFWFERLWHSSVPWLKEMRTFVLGHEELVEPKLSFNVLALYCGRQSDFRNAARRETTKCHSLPWFDPYRILLMRMHCGIPTRQLARRDQLQQAFQLQSPQQRQLITENKDLFADYPALLPEQENTKATTEPTETEDELEELQSQLQTSKHDDIGSVGAIRISESTQEKDLEATSHQLDEVVATLDEAVLGIPELDDDHLEGLSQAITPIRKYVDSMRREFVRKEMVESLRELDGVYGKLPEHIQRALSGAMEKLEQFLNRQRLEAVLPSPGKHYSPHLHGEAVDLECSNTVPVDHIVRCIRRGYRDLDTRQFIIDPKVIVSSGPCDDGVE